MNELYKKLFEAGVTNKTPEQFMAAYSSPEGLRKLHGLLFNAQVTNKTFEEFQSAYGDTTPTQTTPEPELSREEMAVAGVNSENQEYWDNNHWAGDIGDYTRDAEGNYVDSDGDVVMWWEEQGYNPDAWSIDEETGQKVYDPSKENPDATGRWRHKSEDFIPGEDYIPTQDEINALHDQVKNQNNQLQLVRTGVQGLEEVEQDPLENRIYDNTKAQTDFYSENRNVAEPIEEVEGEDMNFTIGNEEWTYIGGSAQSLRLVKRDGEDYVGPDIIMTKTEAIARDIRLGDLINVLSERDSIKLEQENRAKASGAENVGQVTKEDFEKKENTALRGLMNRKDDFLRMGIVIEDRDWEAGVGELTFVNTNLTEGEENRLFKIDAGLFADNSQETIDNLNQWLKDSAYDHDTALKGSIDMSVATQEQQDENKTQAVEYSSEFEKRKNLLINEDRTRENELYDLILNTAVQELNIVDSGVPITTWAQIEEKYKAGSAYRDLYQKEVFTWIANNIDERFPQAKELGFEINIESDTYRYSAGAMSSAVGDTFVETYKLHKGYEITEDFFNNGENAEYNKISNRQIDVVSKDLFIDQLDKAIKEAAPESGQGSQAEADRLGILGPGVSSEMIREIMKSDNPSALIATQYPEYADLLENLPSFSDIKQGVNASDPTVRETIIRSKKRQLDIEDGQANIMETLNASSSAWWAEEEFQSELDDEAKVRYNELDADQKEKVRAVKGINRQVERNREALDKAILSFDRLRFNGKTAADAIDEIMSKKYTTQEEVDAANEEIDRIRNTYNAARDKIKTHLDAHNVYAGIAQNFESQLDDVTIEFEDIGWYKEVIGDKVGQGVKFANAVYNGALELTTGFMELGGMAGDLLMAGISKGYEELAEPSEKDEEGEEKEEIWDWYQTTAWGDRRVIDAIEAYKQDKDKYIQAPVRMSDIDSWGDFGEFAATAVGQQLPQLALMMATSGISSAALAGMASRKLTTRALLTMGGRLTTKQGIQYFSLGTLSANAAGSKYKRMREENELYRETDGLYGHNYSMTEMFVASIGTGVVEGLSERVTYGIIADATKGMTRASRAAAWGAMKKDGFRKYMAKNVFSTSGLKHAGLHTGQFLSEGASEALARTGENWFDILTGKDVGLFDGVDEAFVTGLLVAGTIKSGPMFSHAIAPFMHPDTKSMLDSVAARRKKLEERKADALTLPEGRMKKQLLDEISQEMAELEVELNTLNEVDNQRMGLFKPSEKKRLNRWFKKQSNLRFKIAEIWKEVGKGKTPNDEQLKQLQDLQNEINKIENKRQKLLDQYTPNIVINNYDKIMRNIKKQAKHFSKRAFGNKTAITTLEGDSEKLLTYLREKAEQGALDPKTVSDTIKYYQEIVENEDTTEQEKADAQRHIDNINAILPILRETAAQEGSGQYGTFFPIIEDNKVVGYELFVNKDTALKDGNFTTAAHEFLHGVLHNSIHQDPVVRQLFAKNMIELLQSGDVQWTNQNAMMNFWGKILSYEDGMLNGEEMMTNLSEAMINGHVKIKRKGLGRIGGMVDRILGMAGTGAGYSFGTQENLKRFLINYSDSVKKNYVNRTLLKSAVKKDGITGELSLTIPAGTNWKGETLTEDKVVTLKELQKDIRETEGFVSFSKGVDNLLRSDPSLLLEFDNTMMKPDGTRITSKEELLQHPNLMDDAYKLIRNSTKLDGLIRGMAIKMGLDLEGTSMQQFMNEVKDNLSMRYLTQFDPAKNESLFGWMAGTFGMQQSALRFAVLDVMKNYATTVSTISFDAQMDDSGTTFVEGIADTDAASDDSISMNEGADGLTIFLASLNTAPALANKIRAIVETSGIDITGLTYKRVKKLLVGPNAPLKGVIDLVANEFGIPTKKIVENKDLDGTQRTAAQQFVVDNAQALLDMLPEGQNQSGMAVGLPRVLLNKFYEKGERVKASEGAGTQGKVSQNKRGDITIEEFKAAFGINTDGTFENNKKFDGALRALATQAAVITANQTLRQVAIDNSTNPMSDIALLGDGKGALMFSRKANRSRTAGAGFAAIPQAISKLGTESQNIFYTRMPLLAQAIVSNAVAIEDGKKINKEKKFTKPAIESAVNKVYKDALTQEEISIIANAAMKVAMGNTVKAQSRITEDRAPVVEQQIVDGLYKLSLDSDTKLGTFFGTGQMTSEMKDPKGTYVAEMQAQAIAYIQQRVNKIKTKHKDPQKQGYEIMRFIVTIGQQLHTAAKIGGNRNQYFTGPLYIEQVWRSIPGLEFNLTDKGVIDYSSITYNNEQILVPDRYTSGKNKYRTKTNKAGEVVYRPAEPKDFISPQTSKSAVDAWLHDYFNNTDELSRRNANAEYAGEILVDQIKHYSELHNNEKIGAKHMQMLVSNLLSNMQPVLGRAAMLEGISEDLLPPNWQELGIEKIQQWHKDNNTFNKINGKSHPGEAVYEHMQQRVAIGLGLVHAELFGEGASTSMLNNFKVSIISKRMDDVLKAEGLQTALYELQNLDDDAFVRYFNELTLKHPEWNVGFIKLDKQAQRSDVADLRARVAEILQPKIKAIEQTRIANAALEFSRKPSDGRKGVSVWDFDDTLARTKSDVLFTAADGTTGRLTAEEFAKRGKDLLDQGHVFDFSEFNKVQGGKPGPLFDKALERAKKFGTKDTFILTARAPESQPAIKQFLDSIGLRIPSENIVGLGNSTGKAKADWITENIIGKGYNDIYFADDAMQNVEAVQDVLNRFDVKGVTQQAKIDFSRRGANRLSEILEQGELDLSRDFNTILEETKGVGRRKRFSPAKANKRGKDKGKFKFFLPPSAEDFKGLIYSFLGKGKIGEQHHEWFKKNLFDPFSKGIRHLNAVKQAVANDVKQLKNALPDVKTKLRKTIPGMEFTYQDAVRVYNWNRMGIEVPGLSQADLDGLLDVVKKDEGLRAFADGLNSIMQQSVQQDITPDNSWLAGTIESDISDALANAREVYLREFIENSDIVFNEENLNKIEAVYGTRFRDALEDILYRMRTGSTRNFGSNKMMNDFVNWVHGSIGATMFFNARSSLLQQLSIMNFINWHDNNPLKAAGAVANLPQFVADIAMIFNSPWLKQRRGGIGTDLNAAELLKEMQGSKNPMKSLIAYLLKIGFTPTQIGDSVAIATGGAMFYRNRVKSYMKKGMSRAEAENQAFLDMQEIAEETQQSTREDKISQQQASPLGKLILAFQNTPMQYNRLMKRAAQDWINGRGDPKEHGSKILYYGMVQSLIFYGLQQGLFAALFGDDEEDELTEDKKVRLLNGMMDSVLRGAGITGAVVSTVKNTILEFMEQEKKADDGKFYTEPDHAYTLLESLNLSPPIGIKARKMYSAMQTWEFNRDVIKHMDKTDLDNPMYDALFNVIEATTNLPLHRMYNKYQNIQEALNSDNETWQRIAIFLGWSKYNFGIRNQDVMTARDEVKEIKAAEAEERREQKKIEKQAEIDAQNEAIIQEHVEEQNLQREDGVDEKSITCAAINKSGKRCGKKVLPGQSYCTIHEKVEQRPDGKKTQCTHVKETGVRCKMQTTNKSGKCYYHD